MRAGGVGPAQMLCRADSYDAKASAFPGIRALDRVSPHPAGAPREPDDRPGTCRFSSNCSSPPTSAEQRPEAAFSNVVP